ncbi:MAG: PqqD family protein [Lentisphaerae bacterium]|nr:PqqD family protein [Lentisphaerota bacterium]
MMDDKRFVRADDVELRAIAGEHFLIVLHAGESKMFSLNGMGLWFWQQMARPVAKAELLEAMQAEYEVDEGTARAEIDRFLAYLVALGLACPTTCPPVKVQESERRTPNIER